jgi:hypothetical protein
MSHARHLKCITNFLRLNSLARFLDVLPRFARDVPADGNRGRKDEFKCDDQSKGQLWQRPSIGIGQWELGSSPPFRSSIGVADVCADELTAGMKIVLLRVVGYYI